MFYSASRTLGVSLVPNTNSHTPTTSRSQFPHETPQPRQTPKNVGTGNQSLHSESYTPRISLLQCNKKSNSNPSIAMPRIIPDPLVTAKKTRIRRIIVYPEQNTRTGITTPALLCGEQYRVTSNTNLTLLPSRTTIQASATSYRRAYMRVIAKEPVVVVELRYNVGWLLGYILATFRDLVIEILSIVRCD